MRRRVNVRHGRKGKLREGYAVDPNAVRPGRAFVVADRSLSHSTRTPRSVQSLRDYIKRVWRLVSSIYDGLKLMMTWLPWWGEQKHIVEEEGVACTSLSWQTPPKPKTSRHQFSTNTTTFTIFLISRIAQSTTEGKRLISCKKFPAIRIFHRSVSDKAEVVVLRVRPACHADCMHFELILGQSRRPSNEPHDSLGMMHGRGISVLPTHQSLRRLIIWRRIFIRLPRAGPMRVVTSIGAVSRQRNFSVQS